MAIELYTDEQIVSWCQSSDSTNRGFKLLMQKYQERLYWHIRRMVVTHEDTDDVLQNAFIKVYKNIGNFRGDSQLYTWLYRIATNEAMSHMRKKEQKYKHNKVEADEHLTELKADEYFDGNQVQEQLTLAIAGLPARQKAVFNMRYYDEMSYADIAEVLELSVGSLKASYHHAVKKIEKYIHERS